MGPVDQLLFDQKRLFLVYQIQHEFWFLDVEKAFEVKRFGKNTSANGRYTSFWYDSWSQLGCLKDLLNGRGSYDFGIDDEAHIADVLRCHRRRRHMLSILNQLEDEIDTLRTRVNQEKDILLWKYKEGKYSKQFSTKKTWLYLRQSQPECIWNKLGVWLPQSTPKYSLTVWLASQNRLQTCDRMQLWNRATDTTCVLC